MMARGQLSPPSVCACPRVCTSVVTAQWACGGQRIIGRSQLSSPTMWVPEIQLKSSGLVESNFTCKAIVQTNGSQY